MSIDFKSFDSANGPIYFHQQGSGVPLLMIHGYPGRPQDFRWLFPALQKHFTIYTIALPGMGITPLKSYPASRTQEMMPLISLFLKTLGIEKCYLLGYSMGGTLCNHFAAQYPQHLLGLILLSSVGPTPHRAYRQLRPKWTYSLLTGVLKPLALPILRFLFQKSGFPRGISDETLLHVTQYAMQLDFAEHKKCMQKIQCKTLLIYTENDPLIEKQIFLSIEQALPQVESLVFDKGGHCPQREHFETISQAIIDFHV